jgi:AAHS family 4-hydroxybenzoate transporter-like MFS transporter
LPQDVAFTSANRGKGASKASIRELFTPEYRRDTLGLFGSFFFCLLALYVGISWIVSMLTGAGFTQVDASNALAGFNFGGVAGAILGALIIQRLGSRITMLGMSALAVATAVAMATMRLDPQNTVGLTVMFVVAGSLMNAVQTTMYALAAHVYPTEIRGRGVGTAVAIGRIGNVLSPYAGSFALDRGGSPAFFSTWAITMTLVFFFLSAIRRHIARTSSSERAVKQPAAVH